MLGEGCVGDQIGEGLVAYSGIFGVAKEAGVKVGRDVLEQGAFALLQNDVGAVFQAVDLADKLMNVGSLVGRMLIARAWQGTRASDAKRDPRLVLGHCYGKCRTRMQSWKLADEATDDRRQGGSPLSTYFSTCRQRQEGSPPRTRTLLRKVSYSDAPRTQSRKLAAEAATEICTKFSDTRDYASERRSRRTREAVRLRGQISGDGWVNGGT